ncbi:glycosyltransferase [Pseudomonas sp. CCI3.2]|uniref:glycosyltransferase n=1 Tax=unclassified Pseudomonas TaxID=196821 RepID=UPI002AC9B5F9|nr:MULTISPECIES: glycosyltransferase [unclassified Pseudomonas]MEB0078657.1 glycosyltransferase [Pseudomonas sp. MH10out]MEB0093957.1 glycosyltransferase [Pseudomonas sp. CCI4.2]MEB0103721.1 glycosyltransferase [Pseudomonas sp. CCI3.2]MEB0131201.1 glycosyltransferase [Pseudomonas sp. CCI2.4]MEB0158126.1 glycosyltransferase [Pseudomonas sp. AH2 (2023)]
MKPSRLVSIAIPAYKAIYFEASIASALSQNYDEIEIVICDDCPTEEIAIIVERIQKTSHWPIRYFRNEVRLGETKNAARCIAEAKGHYIKFLYDDDIILPDCVRLLVDVLERNPEVILASSRRQFIDENDDFSPVDRAIFFPFDQNTIIEGKSLVSFLGQHIINFIGEPSCVMFRRADVLAFGDDLMSLNGRVSKTLGDLTIYVKLLRAGNLAIIKTTLSYFRISTVQFSHHLRENNTLGWDDHQFLKQTLDELGWINHEIANCLIGVAPFGDPLNFKPFNLLKIFVPNAVTTDSAINVQGWLKKRVTPAGQRLLLDQRLSKPGAPTFLIVISNLDNDAKKLLSSLTSLSTNESKITGLCVVVLSAYDDLPDKDFGTALMWAEATVDNRSLVINDLVAQSSSAQWIILIDAGTTFTHSGLQSVALQLTAITTNQAVYADELYRQPGDAPGPVLRPDFNLDYLLSFPLVTSKHWLFHRAAFLNVGGLDPHVPHALEFDLILRLIERHGMEGFGHISEPLLVCDAPSAEQNADEHSTLQRHLHVRGYENSQVIQTLPRRYHIQYGHAAVPVVSIVITLNGHLNSLIRCVESILEKTTYQQYELLIIDNHSQDPDTVDWLAGIESMGSEKIKVVRCAHTLNYSASNNLAARHAKGEYLVLLNDETAILQNSWLDELLNHAMRPEVGIVGAKLLDAEGNIQHAGFVLGLNGPVQSVFMQQPHLGPSYMQRLEVDQNYSAVSAACLMVRTSLFNEVDGLDEVQFGSAYSDVDLCLKVGAHDLLVVWTPHASLLYEPRLNTAGSEEADTLDLKNGEEGLYAKWLPIIGNDPAYNKNFSLTGADFHLQFNSDLTWRPLSWRPLPVVLCHPAAPWGSAAYRLIKPFETLRDTLRLDGASTPTLLSMSELAQFNPDSVILQRHLDEHGLESLRLFHAYSKAYTVYEMDEYPLSIDNVDNVQSLQALRSCLNLVDRVVVSSAGLADALSSMHSNIHILEDRLTSDWWLGHQSLRRQGNKLRVGWVGEAQQLDDLELLIDVVKILAHEVEWVVMGDCPLAIRPYVHDCRPLPFVEGYPASLASLNLDLALIPLKQTLSNELRSNLMVLKYGAFGIPVIASDIRCFQDSLNITRVKTTTAAWVEAIRAHINDADASDHMGDELHRQVTGNWMLDKDHADHWLAAWLPD